MKIGYRMVGGRDCNRSGIGMVSYMSVKSCPIPDLTLIQLHVSSIRVSCSKYTYWDF